MDHSMSKGPPSTDSNPQELIFGRRHKISSRGGPFLEFLKPYYKKNMNSEPQLYLQTSST